MAISLYLCIYLSIHLCIYVALCRPHAYHYGVPFVPKEIKCQITWFTYKWQGSFINVGVHICSKRSYPFINVTLHFINDDFHINMSRCICKWLPAFVNDDVHTVTTRSVMRSQPRPFQLPRGRPHPPSTCLVSHTSFGGESCYCANHIHCFGWLPIPTVAAVSCHWTLDRAFAVHVRTYYIARAHTSTHAQAAARQLEGAWLTSRNAARGYCMDVVIYKRRQSLTNATWHIYMEVVIYKCSMT